MKGRLAFSRAGHDKGKLYLIVRQEGERVWLADGRTRSVQDLSLIHIFWRSSGKTVGSVKTDGLKRRTKTHRMKQAAAVAGQDSPAEARRAAII